MTNNMYLEWMDLDAIQYAPQNPKLHDLGSITSSIQRYSFTSPPILDERTGRLVAGQGRIESLRAMKKGNQDTPQNIKSENGKWFVPVIRGIEFKDEREALAYLVDDNAISMLGSDLNAFDMAKIWDIDSYLAALQGLAVENQLPISVDGDALDSLLKGNETDKDSNPVRIPEQWNILIECENEAMQAELLERFVGENIKARALIS